MDEDGLDDWTLRRIVALLVSLAGLAECAAARSFPIRLLVLSILRRAERPARRFAAEATQCAWLADEDPHVGNRPEDALTLAALLRALAALLDGVLRQGSVQDLQDHGHDANDDLAHPLRRVGDALAGLCRAARHAPPRRSHAPIASGAGPPPTLDIAARWQSCACRGRYAEALGPTFTA